jgi:hypothetical protein
LNNTVEIVELSRELATDLSGVIPSFQRKLREPWVSEIAKEMSLGRWELSPDAITVTLDANNQYVALVNGQHRVMARLRADCVDNPHVILLKKRAGVDASIDPTYAVTDAGIPRNLGDYLKMQGQPYYREVAALVRFCMAIEAVGDQSTHSPRPTMTATIAWWNAHSENYGEVALDAIRCGNRMKDAYGDRSTMVAALYFQAHLLGLGEDVEEFFDLAASGVGEAGTGPRVWAQKVAKWNGGALKPTRHRYWNTLLVAWNNFLDGKVVDQLRWTRSMKPQICPDPAVPFEEDL